MAAFSLQSISICTASSGSASTRRTRRRALGDRIHGGKEPLGASVAATATAEDETTPPRESRGAGEVGRHVPLSPSRATGGGAGTGEAAASASAASVTRRVALPPADPVPPA